MKTLHLILALHLSFVCQAETAASRVMEATFKIYHPNSTATGFLVEKDRSIFLVTAAHVLDSTKGETATLVLRKKKPDGSYERLDHTIKVRNADQPLWKRDAKQDVAALKLEALPIPVNCLPFSVLANDNAMKDNELDIGSDLFMLTYPSRLEADESGLPVARTGIFASTPLLPQKSDPTYLADMTTFSGDSGGPVFVKGKDGGVLLIGIMIAKKNHDEKFQGEFGEQKTRFPMGLGVILHANYARQLLEAK